MRYLEERGYGLDVGGIRVPIVPTAILFDLRVGSYKVRPGAEEGYKACLAATNGPVAEGTVGAGTGATVGKLLGVEWATEGGLGTASQQFGDGIMVGAIVAVNAIGDVVDPETGQTLAGPRRAEGGFLSTTELLKRGETWEAAPTANTTIGVVATNACLTKVELTKVAQMAHDGLARVIRPVHTMFDGDAIFALSLGDKLAAVTTIGAVAAEVVATAVIRAILQAESLLGIPAARDLVGGAR